MSTPNFPDPAFNDSRWHTEHSDLLRKIATILTALTVLALISVILQIVGLVRADEEADQIQNRLDNLRAVTAVTP